VVAIYSHLPAARLRPADPRRGAAEPAGACSRSTAAGLVGADGATHCGAATTCAYAALHARTLMPDRALRRERVPPDALTSAFAPTTQWPCATRAAPASGAAQSRGSAATCRWARARCAGPARPRRHPRLRHAAARRRWKPPAELDATVAEHAASSSRWTPTLVLELARTPRGARHRRGRHASWAARAAPCSRRWPLPGVAVPVLHAGPARPLRRARRPAKLLACAGASDAAGIGRAGAGALRQTRCTAGAAAGGHTA
jgi:hypothetical protein